MRKLCLILVVLSVFVGLAGATCSPTGIAENATTDIQGWDLSACVNGFGTCWQLFWDNSDKITGGTGAVINNLNPLKPGESTGLKK